ncbi:MAG: FGGY-family carbohydrate kinase, partial [Agrobacterium vaccinii]
APISTISVSGGAGAHPLTRQLLADTTGYPVEVTECEEPVLLGSAILGAVAAKLHDNLQGAMATMSRVEMRCDPDEAVRALHDIRYTAFIALQNTARDIRKSMDDVLHQSRA